MGDGAGLRRWPGTYFEQALLQVCEKCDGDYLPKCCFTCQYADYSPYGCDDFGSMLCYRKHKEIYLTVNDKEGFFDRLEGLDFEVQQETGGRKRRLKRPAGM